MQRGRPLSTWLTAWALACAIASTILLCTAKDGQQMQAAALTTCAAGAGCAP